MCGGGVAFLFRKSIKAQARSSWINFIIWFPQVLLVAKVGLTALGDLIITFLRGLLDFAVKVITAVYNRSKRDRMELIVSSLWMLQVLALGALLIMWGDRSLFSSFAYGILDRLHINSTYVDEWRLQDALMASDDIVYEGLLVVAIVHFVILIIHLVVDTTRHPRLLYWIRLIVLGLLAPLFAYLIILSPLLFVNFGQVNMLSIDVPTSMDPSNFRSMLGSMNTGLNFGVVGLLTNLIGTTVLVCIRAIVQGIHVFAALLMLLKDHVQVDKKFTRLITIYAGLSPLIEALLGTITVIIVYQTTNTGAWILYWLFAYCIQIAIILIIRSSKSTWLLIASLIFSVLLMTAMFIIVGVSKSVALDLGYAIALYLVFFTSTISAAATALDLSRALSGAAGSPILTNPSINADAPLSPSIKVNDISAAVPAVDLSRDFSGAAGSPILTNSSPRNGIYGSSTTPISTVPALSSSMSSPVAIDQSRPTDSAADTENRLSANNPSTLKDAVFKDHSGEILLDSSSSSGDKGGALMDHLEATLLNRSSSSGDKGGVLMDHPKATLLNSSSSSGNKGAPLLLPDSIAPIISGPQLPNQLPEYTPYKCQFVECAYFCERCDLLFLLVFGNGNTTPIFSWAPASFVF